MLEENSLLIEIVIEYQNKGKITECMKYQDILTRNLLYLSGISEFQVDENFDPSLQQKQVKSEHETIQINPQIQCDEDGR